MTVEVRYLTDPACAWSWGAEPKLRRLMWEFGDGLRFRFVLGGLARSYGPEYRDSDGGIGAGSDPYADLMAHWLEVSAQTGMPVDPRIWRVAPLSSTYPACIAVKAAQDQGPDAAYRYLRRLREAIMLERRKADNLEALVAVAEPAGIDAQRFRIDAQSNDALERFGYDLDEVRTIPDETRAVEGAVAETEGRERLAFPALVFVAEGGERHAVYGRADYEAWRAAAIAAGAEPANAGKPGVMEVVERFGRVATREVEEITGLPAPVARAELWSLAREWRLRPVPVLGGELWETA